MPAIVLQQTDDPTARRVQVVQGTDAPDSQRVQLVTASGEPILPSGVPEPFVLWTVSPQCVGLANVSYTKTAPSSNAWSTNNLAFFFPFTITTPRTYVGMIWLNGATVGAGNVNGAIYSADGVTALATIGSVAQSGTTAPQQKAFPAPVTLQPGTYYMALSLDTSTNTIVATLTTAGELRAFGVRSLGSAFALTAAAAAWVGIGVSRGWLFGIYEPSWL